MVSKSSSFWVEHPCSYRTIDDTQGYENNRRVDSIRGPADYELDLVGYPLTSVNVLSCPLEKRPSAMLGLFYQRIRAAG